MWAKTLLLAAALALGSVVTPGAQSLSQAQTIQPNWVIPAQGRGARGGGERQNLVSMREVIEMIRSRFGGEMVGRPRLEQNGDRPFYVVSWRLPNEVVQEFRVDAVTGQMR